MERIITIPLYVYTVKFDQINSLQGQSAQETLGVNAATLLYFSVTLKIIYPGPRGFCTSRNVSSQLALSFTKKSLKAWDKNHITHFNHFQIQFSSYGEIFKQNELFEKKKTDKTLKNLLYEGHQLNLGIFGSNDISTTFKSKPTKIPEEQCIQAQSSPKLNIFPLTSNIRFLAHRLRILALSRGAISTKAH